MEQAIITYIMVGLIQIGSLVFPTTTTCVIAPIEFDTTKITADFECFVVAGGMTFKAVGTVYNLEASPNKEVYPDLASY